MNRQTRIINRLSSPDFEKFCIDSAHRNRDKHLTKICGFDDMEDYVGRFSCDVCPHCIFKEVIPREATYNKRNRKVIKRRYLRDSEYFDKLS